MTGWIRTLCLKTPVWGGSLLILVLGLFVYHSQSATQELGLTRIRSALGRLNEVPAGARLILRAQNTWHEGQIPALIKYFSWGRATRTDTILTRHYNPKTGIEEREREITVFLREDQTEVELVLDIAHELVHATARPAYDPYDSSLTAGKYIQSALDGEGGEVDAVMTECQVAGELSGQMGVRIPRCQNYLQPAPTGFKVEREKVRSDFYRVGKWQTELLSYLGNEINLFPLLSDKTPKFYSSTGHAPYPVALLKEFQEITNLACKNSRKRVIGSIPGSTSTTKSPPQSPSESSDSSVQVSQRDTFQFIQNRCN